MLNRSSFAMGQLVGAGMLEEDSTTAILEDAGQRIGLDVGEVRRSVASGLRAGARNPRTGCPSWVRHNSVGLEAGHRV
jgi:hypothetical protein